MPKVKWRFWRRRKQKSVSAITLLEDEAERLEHVPSLGDGKLAKNLIWAYRISAAYLEARKCTASIRRFKELDDTDG